MKIFWPGPPARPVTRFLGVSRHDQPHFDYSPSPFSPPDARFSARAVLYYTVFQESSNTASVAMGSSEALLKIKVTVDVVKRIESFARDKARLTSSLTLRSPFCDCLCFCMNCSAVRPITLERH